MHIRLTVRNIEVLIYIPLVLLKRVDSLGILNIVKTLVNQSAMLHYYFIEINMDF
jgi:hypothetical protein